MRFFLTVIAALMSSGLAGSMVAVMIADWAKGDESYILVFMAVPLFSLIGIVFFMIAWTRPRPRGAIDKVGIFLSALLIVWLAGLSAIEFLTGPGGSASWRAFQLFLAIVGSCFAAIVVQWIIFRSRARSGPPASPALGVIGRAPNG